MEESTKQLRKDYFMMNLHSEFSLGEMEMRLIKRKLSWLLSLDHEDPIDREELFEGLFGIRSNMERIRLHNTVADSEKRAPGIVPDEIRAPYPTVLDLDGGRNG